MDGKTDKIADVVVVAVVAGVVNQRILEMQCFHHRIDYNWATSFSLNQAIQYIDLVLHVLEVMQMGQQWWVHSPSTFQV